MGKLVNALIFIFVINLVMILFLGVSVPGSSLWSLVTNPENWSSLSLINFVTDAFLLIGIAGIVVGTLLSKDSDFYVFAGITAIFLSFGASLFEFYQQLNSQSLFSQNLTTSVKPLTLAMIIIAPMIIMYLYLALKFWRGND